MPLIITKQHNYIYIVPAISSLKQTVSVQSMCCYRSFQGTEIIFIGLEPRMVFRVCDPCPCNLLAETSESGLGALLLSCIVSNLQKTSSPGFEARTVPRSFGLYKMFSWFQGIDVPSLRRICESLLEL
jgi:hypothetical protein